MNQQQGGEDDAGTVTVKSLSACNYTDQISVLVGPDERLFLVHKDVIIAKSKFFKAACSKRWSSGREKVVKLPNADPQVFQDYLGWVYSGRLDHSSKPTDTLDQLDRIASRYYELYLFGDVVDDLLLRNEAMRLLVTDTSALPGPGLVERIWDKTPENSPVRRMLVDRVTMRKEREFITKLLAYYPQGFVRRIAVSLLQHVPAMGEEFVKTQLPSYLEPTEAVN